jgi:hypothetical protein
MFMSLQPFRDFVADEKGSLEWTDPIENIFGILFVITKD